MPSQGCLKEPKWPMASICVPCCPGSAPSLIESRLNACAVPGMPEVGFDFVT